MSKITVDLEDIVGTLDTVKGLVKSTNDQDKEIEKLKETIKNYDYNYSKYLNASFVQRLRYLFTGRVD